MAGNINKDVLRVIKPFIEEVVGEFYAGSGSSLPSKASIVGQLFIKTGSTNPGLYVATGTTTPGWKAVTHAE